MRRPPVLIALVVLALVSLESALPTVEARRRAVADDLTCYWPMDDASGAAAANAVDANDASCDLANNASVGSATGVVSNARDFESADTDYLSAGDSAILSLGADTAFSFAFWMNAESVTGFRMPIIHKGAFGASDDEYLVEFDDSAGAFRFLVGDGATFGNVTETQPSTANAHFVVVWHDPTADTVNIAINNDATPASAAWSSGTQNTASAFQIGKAVGSGAAFDGWLDEVGFWKKVLTSDERTWLYNSGSGRSYADIQAEGATGAAKGIGGLFRGIGEW